MRTLTLLNWNFEDNGGGDRAKWATGHDLLARLNPDLLFRQEPWDAADNGYTIHNQQEDVLGLRGWIGARSRTAVYADPSLFAPVRDWRDNVAPMWVQPPTPMLLRYQPAGRTAMPFVAVSYHLHYCSVTNRASESESLTAYADRKWKTHDGQKITPPILVGGDNNSYPHQDLPGAPNLPDLSSIKDKRHMVHRSRLLPDGSRVPDTEPDKTLRDAELFDLARYWAEKSGDTSAVARTVNASDTHGGDSRIDRVYGSTHFLPAVIGVDVIEVDPDLSDHHIVRVKLDRDVLVDILNEQQELGA
jgi:endonuclease/exonuclease/phosphatase family metal-dependent hydrolase